MELDFSQALRQLALQGNRADCCRVCGEPATRLRLLDGTYGKRPSGREFTPEEFLVQLEVELEEPDHSDNSLPLDQLVGFCDSHSVQRNSGKLDQLGDSGAGPSENTLALTKERRLAVLTRLGNACADCGTRDVVLLQVALKPDQPADAWSAIGVRSWPDKYEALASQESLLSIVDCVCSTCAQVRLSPKRSASKQNLRERVIEGYGSKCGVCSVPVDNRTAWLVRLAGTEPLRHSNGAGRKFTTRQKYLRLLKDGCPSGWELRCPAHQGSPV